MSVLRVAHLAKAFDGVQAVADVSFALEAGELLAMIGPNGAGKSTCFNLLNGQLAPDAGSIALEGQPVAGKSPRDMFRLGVGRTFQITAAFGSLTVAENVQVALLSHARRLNGLVSGRGKKAEAESIALLSQIGIAQHAARTCAELAYGDLKRVELAIALASQPRVLLMDEPTAGMAAAERRALMQLVADLARVRSMAVLFTEHDMDVVFRHADRVIVLAEGRVIAEGRPAEVRANPAVQAAYLGSIDA